MKKIWQKIFFLLYIILFLIIEMKNNMGKKFLVISEKIDEKNINKNLFFFS
jgi:hypothetical protein